MKRGLQAIDTNMLAVNYGEGLLLRQTNDLPVVRLIQPNISPELIKKWLRYCQENHSSACKEGSEATLSISTISSFKVINCETRQVVQGCRAPYIALSYVWGAGERGPSFSSELPAQLPTTIEDAITVTLSLGMQYLWIDRYCIIQSNPTEVQEQVGQMDLIYRCAYLTIIAAAGDTPNYGLPGVGTRKRQPQPHGMVQGHMLISTLPDPIYAIKRSKWSQRAWTYQEGILSPRRLVFTDDQIYFECSGMYCCEALDLPLSKLHTQNGQRFKSQYCNGLNIGMFPRGFGTSDWEIVQRIEDYTTKHLTNPSDILNGISGILQAFTKNRKRVLHCAGVPMISKYSTYSRKKQSQTISREWTSLLGFCGGLCWTVKSPTNRRKGFPSWSWSGWHGQVNWGLKDDEWRVVEPSKDVQISVQLENGSVADLETFCRHYDDMSMRVSNILHIAAWIFQLYVYEAEESSYFGFRYKALLKFEDTEPAAWYFSPTGNEPIPWVVDCYGMILCRTMEGDSYPKLYVLVMQKRRSGIFERVGFGEMNVDKLETDSKHREGSPEPLMRFWEPLPRPKVEWKEFQLL